MEVDLFFCVTLATSKKIKYVACHHEQAVSFAAESYSRFHNKPSLAMVTTGPGGTTITGVTSSWIDSVPVIFISGQVYLNQTIGKSKIRQRGSRNKYYRFNKTNYKIFSYG